MVQILKEYHKFSGPKITMSMLLYCFDLEINFHRHPNFLHIPYATLTLCFVLYISVQFVTRPIIFIYPECILFPLSNVSFHSRPPDHGDYFLRYKDDYSSWENGLTSKFHQWFHMLILLHVYKSTSGNLRTPRYKQLHTYTLTITYIYWIIKKFP